MNDPKDYEEFDDDIEWSEDQDQTDEPPIDIEELCRISGVNGIGEFLDTYLEKNTQEIVKILISKFGEEGNDLDYAKNLKNIINEIGEYFEVFEYEGKKIYATDFSHVTEFSSGKEPIDYARGNGFDKENKKYEIKLKYYSEAIDHYNENGVCVICKTKNCFYQKLEDGVDWSDYEVKPL